MTVGHGPRQLPLTYTRASAAAFEQFILDNPHVWKLFVRFAMEVIDTGRDHYSADAICHRIRWHVDIETRDREGFKINNNYTAFLARRFEGVFPEHMGFFRTREQKRSSVAERRATMKAVAR